MSLLTTLLHEMWRDEWQAILIVNESHSLRELFSNLRYEGHGLLWYLLIKPVIALFGFPEAVQIFHWILGCVNLYLILFYAPFKPWLRILSCSGYYFLYEYAVISRHYVLTVMLVLLFCAVDFNTRRVFWRTLILFILPHTGIYGILSSVMLILVMWKELKGNEKLIIGSLILLSTVVSCFFLDPPSDGGFAVEWFFQWDWIKFQRSVEIIYEAMVPLPENKLDFWGSNFLDFSPYTVILKPGLSLLLLLYFYLVFRKDRAIMAGLFLSSIAIVLFTYVKYEGYLRHYGHIWILFFAAMWLFRGRYGFKRGTMFSLCFLIFIHVAASSVAIAREIRHPFSGANETAAFIRDNGLSDSFISADTDFIGVPVSGYLGKEIYYPQAKRSGTFILLDSVRANLIDFDLVYKRTVMHNKAGKKVLFMLDYYPDTSVYNIKEIFRTPETIVQDERYYLFGLKDTIL